MADIALALLIIDDKILVCKRENKPDDQFSGKYGLPGGHVRENETKQQGAIRETKEETNLTIHNPKYVNSYKFDNNQIYLYAEEINNIDGIKLNHEHTDYKLVTPEEIKDPSIVPTTKFMFNDYLQKFGEKPPKKEQTDEDLEYAHVTNASPERTNFAIGFKKIQ
jgi:8-oxo-dGTP pyrophosphatase MutT (NUDIX family)